MHSFGRGTCSGESQFRRKIITKYTTKYVVKMGTELNWRGVLSSGKVLVEVTRARASGVSRLHTECLSGEHREPESKEAAATDGRWLTTCRNLSRVEFVVSDVCKLRILFAWR